MWAFAELLDRLFFTYSHLDKSKLLQDYFRHTPDPERGYALAIMTGALTFKSFKGKFIQDLITSRVDPILFGLSYDYVGDLSETVALLWPSTDSNDDTGFIFPTIETIISKLNTLNKTELADYLADLFDHSNATERWALLKFANNDLRIGVAARFLKNVLANYGNKSIEELEQVWPSQTPPYEELFAWLEGKIDKPDIYHSVFFHPVMLANPLTEKELDKLDADQFIAERKYDGIRIQVVSNEHEQALFSRSGDNITHAFPDIIATVNQPVVLDGELVIMKNDTISSFNDLQQRLNRKVPSKKLIEETPAHVILYDILSIDKQDLRHLIFAERREKLLTWFNQFKPANMSLSEILIFDSREQLLSLQQQVIEENIFVEGLMLKHKQSAYIAGRPAGKWYKWKRNPYLVDAVLMYAQRGHGKRSSYYSDYTFGLWQDDKLLPIGKAYFGFSDEELLQLDKWIRQNTINRFGPVREVKKELVFEIAFDAVSVSSRHKSGYALRFPRINRIRWDKPAQEADQLDMLESLLRKPAE